MSAVAHFFMSVAGSKIHERLAHFFIDIYTFEQLIERQTCEHFEEWRQQREMAENAA